MRRGFTLVELILAIFILGIGMISVAALFPAGIAQQQASEDEVYGPLVAKHAFDLLRSRLAQDDFGTFEEFTPPGSGAVVRDPVPINRTFPNPVQDGVVRPTTLTGDWSWKRPGISVADDPGTADIDEKGMVDVFSLLYNRRSNGRPVPAGQYDAPQVGVSDLLTEFPRGIPYVSDQAHRLFGIPFNRARYDEQRNVTQANYAWLVPNGTGFPAVGDAGNQQNAALEPGVFFTQRERYWPMPNVAVGPIPPPQYVWDCMFRRFGGRVQVAVFVYRVGNLNGLRGGNPQTQTPYAVSKVTTNLDPDFGAEIAAFPSVPQWASSRPGSPGNLRRVDGTSAGRKWGAGGLDERVGSTINASLYGVGRDDSSVPGTEPLPAAANTDDPAVIGLDFGDGWQAPGQWFVDFFGNVHRVVAGRRTRADGPVTLAKPVPRQPYGDVLVDLHSRRLGQFDTDALVASPRSGGDALDGIQDVWFVPLQDSNGNDLTPVYVAIEEL
jgi:prepilin-type N-terminal cleavage/methylation domain-containing protein